MSGYASWTCVHVDPKDAEGLGNAKLVVVVSLGFNHNKINELTADAVHVDLGVTKKSGHANIELLGFLAFLFDVQEDRIRIETGDKSQRFKVVVISGLRHEKRELIWFLEKKAGMKHEAHFAVDSLNAARKETSKAAAARQKEMDEFRSLKEEVLNTGLAARAAAPASLAAPAAKKTLAASIKVKRAEPDSTREEAPGPAKRIAGTSDKEESADGKDHLSAYALATTGAGGPNVTTAASAPTPVVTQGIGLAQYGSDDDSDDDDDGPTLPKPFDGDESP